MEGIWAFLGNLAGEGLLCYFFWAGGLVFIWPLFWSLFSCLEHWTFVRVVDMI